MNVTEVNISRDDARKLLSTRSADAAILYLYIQCGNDPAEAQQALAISGSRMDCAAATLRQLGLWPTEKKTMLPTGERPNYTETDVQNALEKDNSFKALCDEIQHVLGKFLTTEEKKILLGFNRYLGMENDVISVLVSFCKERQRQRGSNRVVSLRTIEKEAYEWAEQGIDTLEDAAAYVQARNAHNTRMAHIKHLLQIRGRKLTAAEEKYAGAWAEMGFEDDAILMAYERTCINTGGLKWPYMNSILKRWHEKGLHSAEQINAGDQKVQAKSDRRDLSADELAAIKRMMQEG